MATRVSLANKCLAIFGIANVIIIASILTILWIVSTKVIQDYQLKVAQQLADSWIKSEAESKGFEDVDVSIQLVWLNEIGSEGDKFIERAKNYFLNQDGGSEYVDAFDREAPNYFQYSRAITQTQLTSIRREGVTNFGSGVLDPSMYDPLEAILVVRLNTTFARDQLGNSRAWIIVAGIVGSLLSALVYFLILTRLIFSPVRKLRRVSERVLHGDLTARSTLETGDEFEELADAFNEMLDRMERDQQQLQRMNESLDLKVEELAEVNVGLFESSRLKSEFIANVSHELRTPLNSIIGFAELLESMPVETEDDQVKRIRYLHNILTSGRSLLNMINELLDMAKIESGRMEVNLEPTSISDLLEGLIGIMRPQAKGNQVILELRVDDLVPTIQTDPGKLQQILYNFLSNAIKYAPANSIVTISANRIVRDDGTTIVRIAVDDHGKGIPEDMVETVFEKFRQIDATHTREHSGTGLGLAICRELAELLHSTLSVQSKVGEGATFRVDIPVIFASETLEPLMPQ